MTHDPIMFLPGYPQQPPVWQPVITALAQRGVGAKYLAPWIPGTGPRDHDGFDLDRAISTLATRIDVDAGGRCDVVGLSLGGAVGLALAARCPGLVARLVISGTTPKLSRMESFAQRTAARAVRAGQTGGLPVEQVRATLQSVARLDLRADVTNITCPTLVVVGESDTSRQQAARDLARQISGADFRSIPGGHWLNVEEPTAFASVVGDFLAAEGRTS